MVKINGVLMKQSAFPFIFLSFSLQIYGMEEAQPKKVSFFSYVEDLSSDQEKNEWHGLIVRIRKENVKTLLINSVAKGKFTTCKHLLKELERREKNDGKNYAIYADPTLQENLFYALFRHSCDGRIIAFFITKGFITKDFLSSHFPIDNIASLHKKVEIFPLFSMENEHEFDEYKLRKKLFLMAKNYQKNGRNMTLKNICLRWIIANQDLLPEPLPMIAEEALEFS